MNLIRLAVIHFLSALGLKLWPHVESIFGKRKATAFLFFVLIFVVMTFLALTGCSLVDQRLDPEKYYRRDIQMKINGEEFVGVAVPKKAKSYEIKMKARGKIDMITIRSCHRERVFEDPTEYIGSNRSFTYVYEPIKGIEDGKACLLDIGAFEKIKGRHSWAVVDFNNELENLPAILRCDGVKKNTDPVSVSICQARAGTIQQIIFDHPVLVDPDEGCRVMKTKDEKLYQYLMPLGECTFFFQDKYGNIHRHTTIGYEDILIQELSE